MCLLWMCRATLQNMVTLLGKTQQPHYVIQPETYKYFSILQGCNKWYISKLNLKKETINPDEMKIKDEIVLQGMTQAATDEI